MDRYHIDERILLSIRSALNEDIELGSFIGHFETLARSTGRKLESTAYPLLTTEEYHFLQGYVRDLVVVREEEKLDREG